MVNPHQYAFNKYMSGQEIDFLKHDFYIRRFYKMQRQQLITDICKINNQIAVSSKLLTRRQKDKYKDNRFTSGRNTFYLFLIDSVPFDVYHRIKHLEEENKYVYEEEEEQENFN